MTIFQTYTLWIPTIKEIGEISSAWNHKIWQIEKLLKCEFQKNLTKAKHFLSGFSLMNIYHSQYKRGRGRLFL